VNPFAVVLDGSSYWPRKIENGFGPAGATGLGEITMIGSQEDWRKTTIGAEYRREHRKTYTRWATTVFALYDVLVSIGIVPTISTGRWFRSRTVPPWKLR